MQQDLYLYTAILAKYFYLLTKYVLSEYAKASIINRLLIFFLMLLFHVLKVLWKTLKGKYIIKENYIWPLGISSPSRGAAKIAQYEGLF